MTYTRVTLAQGNGAREGVVLTAAQVSALDAALADQDARITALVTALAALDARVVTLEEA